MDERKSADTLSPELIDEPIPKSVDELLNEFIDKAERDQFLHLGGTLAARYDNTPYVRELFEHARFLANRHDLFGFPEEPVDPRSATVASNAVQKLIEWAKSKRQSNSSFPQLKREETPPLVSIESNSTAPFVPLTNCAEIIAALDKSREKLFLDNNSTMREKITTLNTRHTGNDPQATADGPKDRFRFAWKGKACDLSRAPMRYRLCEVLWDFNRAMPKESVEEAAVLNALYPDDECGENSLKSLVYDINEQSFGRSGVAVRVVRRGGTLWLEGPTAPASFAE